jgi:hypothetical protein
MTTTMNTPIEEAMDTTPEDTVNTNARYLIIVSMKEIEHYLYANSHGEIAHEINTLMGFGLLTKGVIVNWISRGKKSKKYDYITVRYNTARVL